MAASQVIPIIPVPVPPCPWPTDMYVPSGAIKCLVPGCTTTFSANDPTSTQLWHYEWVQRYSNKNPIFKNQHGILAQMHTLKACPICRGLFPERNSRVAFYHVSTVHLNVLADMSTIKGFLSLVRKYAVNFAEDSPNAIEHRRKTFKFAFEHAELQLTMAPSQRDFNTVIMGHGDVAVPHHVLPSLLTVPGPIEFYPVHPDLFLSGVAHNSLTTLLSRTEWEAIRYRVQGLYRKGSV